MENEIMNYDETMTDEVSLAEVDNKSSGMSTGVAMAIGAGLALATTAVVKLGKKLFAAHKAKKAAKKAEEEDYMEVSD